MSIIIAMSALAAGCIGTPEQSATEFEPSSAPPRAERIEGMTAEESRQDSDVACSDNGEPLLELPRACAERILTVEGRIGLDSIPVDLVGSNGPIIVEHAPEDTWSFVAVVRVEALSDEMARDALETAWTWSHEDAAGGHAIRAGPTPTEGAVVTMGASPTARVTYTEYTLLLPEWIVLDVRATTDNGQIVVRGFDMTRADLETDNGEIVVGGSAGDVRIQTDNGAVTGSLTPRSSGTWHLGTDNGQIVLAMPEAARYGYDIAAQADNGQVIIGLHDGRVSQEDGRTTFRTTRYDERAIQVHVDATVDNGQIILG